MRELQAGVWHWEAPHPDWKPSDDWDELVSSYAIDDGERLLLFDPLALPTELEELAGERKTVIVLTCPWHERDTRSLVERFDAAVFVLLGMDANDLILWVESHGAVVAGDAIIDRGDGLEIPADWVGDGLEQVRGSVRAVLELPVKHVFATHGGPSDRAALERAVA